MGIQILFFVKKQISLNLQRFVQIVWPDDMWFATFDVVHF